MRMAGFTPDVETSNGDDEGAQGLRMYLAERNRTEFYRLLQKHNLDASLFRADVAIERQEDSLKNQ